MGRSPLLSPRKFHANSLVVHVSCGISCRFQQLSPASGQVSYVLRTRSPLTPLRASVRLACIRHAASVHPEPGSNSPLFDLSPERDERALAHSSGSIPCPVCLLCLLSFAMLLLKSAHPTRQKTATSPLPASVDTLLKIVPIP